MEVSALKYSGGGGLHKRSRLLRLQSDERLVTLIRRGNGAAFELLVDRYEARLLAFCRHMLGSREDAEDVMQEVLAASYKAIVSDERSIHVRPWLYRIARNRCLNHLRRAQPIGVDSMDIHYSDNGASTADKVHDREEFRMLLDDIQDLPETQRTALVLRELDALSYDQIAEAMETTVSSVKSLLVRARASLAESSEARLLSCEEVRIELAEVAEGLRKKIGPPVRRHVRNCEGCRGYDTHLKRTGRALSGLLPLGPIGPALLLKKLLLAPLGHSAGSGAAGAGSAGAAGTAGATASGIGGAVAGAGTAGAAAAGTSGGLLTAGVGAIASKAAAGLAAAALVTAGAVEAGSSDVARRPAPATTAAATAHSASQGAAQANLANAAVAAPIGRAKQAGKAATKTNKHLAPTSTSTTTTPANKTSTSATTTTPAATTTTPMATTPAAGALAAVDQANGSAGASGGSPVTTPATTTTVDTTTTPGETTTGTTTTGTSTAGASTAGMPTSGTTSTGTTTTGASTAGTTTPTATTTSAAISPQVTTSGTTARHGRGHRHG